MLIDGICGSHPAPLTFFIVSDKYDVDFGMVLHDPAVLLYKKGFDISMFGGIWVLLTPGAQNYMHLCQSTGSDLKLLSLSLLIMSHNV